MADITATYESVSLGDYVGDESRKDLTSTPKYRPMRPTMSPGIGELFTDGREC
jgi:hypothetical protein